MSEERGPRMWEKEKAAIDEAYKDHIKKLFEVFYLSSTAGVTSKEMLAKFKQNLETLRRAHVVATSVFSDHDAV